MLSLLVAIAQVVPLKVGEPAPFDGQLLDPVTAIRLVRLGDVARGEAEADARRLKAWTSIERQRAEALDKSLGECNSGLRKCDGVLKQCQSEMGMGRHMLASPWFWGTMGLLAGTSAGIILAHRTGGA